MRTPQQQLNAAVGALAWARLTEAGLVQGDSVNVERATALRDRLLSEGFEATEGTERLFVAAVLETWGMEWGEAKVSADGLLTLERQGERAP